MRKTIVELLLSEDSSEIVRRYLEENKIVEAKTEFHATLLYTEATPVFQRDDGHEIFEGYLPLKIEPPYDLAIFGKNSLVIKFQDKRFRRIKRKLIGRGMRQLLGGSYLDNEGEMEILKGYQLDRKGERYDEEPHITIASPFLSQQNYNQFPQVPLVFDMFYWEN